jgi:hypothetical protein
LAVGKRFAYAGIASLIASLFVLAANASADVTFCPPGGSAGKCADARGVAVDTETGHVYVADRGNDRVNVFQSDGTFLTSFGAGQLSSPTWIAVDNNPASTSRHDIYVTTSSGDFLVKKFKPTGEYIEEGSFGASGTGPCEFSANEPIGVGPDGNVYIGDSYDKDGPAPSHVLASRVIVFDSAGSCSKEVPLPFEGTGASLLALAVDSEEAFYTLYNGGANVIRKYDAGGALLYGITTHGAKGFGVDDSDRLFVGEQGVTVATPTSITLVSLYSATGEIIKRFGYGPVGRAIDAGVAPYSTVNGDVYVTGYFDGVKYLSLPPPGPVMFPQPCRVKTGQLGSVSATLQADINPENAATTFHFEYVSQAEFGAEGYGSPSESPATPLPGTADYELHEAAAKVEGLNPETVYHCRVVAENAESVSPSFGQDGSFKTREGFEFGPAWTSEVGETSAMVDVEGNPSGLPAIGEVEYVDDAHYQVSGFTEAQKAPPGGVDFGAGETMQHRSVVLNGLTPGTLYHWRLRAKNGVPPQGIVCPEQKATCPELEHTFRTYLPEPSGFDSRRYELVSPGEKNSAEVAVPGNAGGFVEDRMLRVAAGAGSGEAVTYTSWTAFGNTEGAPGSSQYLSKRTAAGWVTENISPFGVQENVLSPSYNGVSPDLNFATLTNLAPALAPGCPEGVNNLYLRDNQSGMLECLTPETAGGDQSPAVCLNFAGASQDGSRAFFAAPAAYADAPAAAGTNLYEWHEGVLRLVSILPDGNPAAPTKKTSFGAGDGNCQSGAAIRQHVVSSDGLRAFWTYVPPEPQPSRLLARVGGTESIQLDALPAVKPGAGPPGNGVFKAAGADGSVVYFTDENRLIAGSKSAPAEPDLYRYEFGSAAPLTNLTRSTTAPGNVRGVVGISEDGSYVYFVAGAVLSGEEENDAGEKAVLGKSNLYLYHAGSTRFIARLANEDPDAGDWSEQPKGLSARVSPDGRHLAFLSIETEALAGYDNRLADDTITGGEHCRWEPLSKTFQGGPRCAQAFVYDAETDSLTCASCNPSGARPLGPTLLPGWTNVFEGPRYLSPSGSRLFFESYDALLPADRNLRRDVYEFELPGEGSCTSGNPNLDPASGSCHFLVSSGKSGDQSYFVDASTTGRDAFIATRQQFVGWDVNENFDVYDVREGGGFPEPPPVPPVCSGETCKPGITPAPSTSPPATPGFQGPGNLEPPQSCKKSFVRNGGKCAKKPCQKGFVRRGGKCVKKSNIRHHHSQRNGRANRTGGAGR